MALGPFSDNILANLRGEDLIQALLKDIYVHRDVITKYRMALEEPCRKYFVLVQATGVQLRTSWRRASRG